MIKHYYNNSNTTIYAVERTKCTDNRCVDIQSLPFICRTREEPPYTFAVMDMVSGCRSNAFTPFSSSIRGRIEGKTLSLFAPPKSNQKVSNALPPLRTLLVSRRFAPRLHSRRSTFAAAKQELPLHPPGRWIQTPPNGKTSPVSWRGRRSRGGEGEGPVRAPTGAFERRRRKPWTSRRENRGRAELESAAQRFWVLLALQKYRAAGFQSELLK